MIKCPECECEFKKEIHQDWVGTNLWLVCPECNIKILLDDFGFE